MYRVEVPPRGDSLLQLPAKDLAPRRGHFFRHGIFPDAQAEQLRLVDEDAVIEPVTGKARRVEYLFIGQLVPGRAGKDLSPIIEETFMTKTRQVVFPSEKAPGVSFSADKSDKGTPGTVLEKRRNGNIKKRV